MRGTRGDLSCVVLLAGALACSGSDETAPGRQKAPGIDPAVATSCDRVDGLVADEKRAAKAMFDGCAADRDCVETGYDTSCAGTCGTAVNRAHAQELAAALAKISARHCEGDFRQSCGYVTPDCLPRLPICRDGHCVLGGAAATVEPRPDAAP